MIVALILARGGSKGIPRKNLAKIKGVSLTAGSVRKCIQAKFDRVFVYTDSQEIAEEAKAAGGVWVERPAEVSGDKVSSEDTVQRFLKDYDPKRRFTYLALIQVTTPFVKPHHLAAGIEAVKSGYDSAITATPFERFMGFPSGDSNYIPCRPYRQLRQDSEVGQWLENGAMYLASRKIWNEGKRIGYKEKVIPVSWWESLEIDDPIDLDIARSIAHLVDGDQGSVEPEVTPPVEIRGGSGKKPKLRVPELRREKFVTRFNRR